MTKHSSQSDFQRISLKELQCIAKPQSKEVDVVESYNKFITSTLNHLRTLLTIRSEHEQNTELFEVSDN